MIFIFSAELFLKFAAVCRCRFVKRFGYVQVMSVVQVNFEC